MCRFFYRQITPRTSSHLTYGVVVLVGKTVIQR